MRSLLVTNLDTDVPFWISKSSFIRNFDQQDFMCRDVKHVVDAYLEEWFQFDTNGKRFFFIPSVSVRQNVTQFISGRHRIAVLLQHLENLPLAFDSRITTPQEEAWVWSIAWGPVDKGVEIELPDLPIRAVLP